MGLFGLFYAAFGLGVLAKDAISDEIDDTRSREMATREGRDTYLVNGYKMRSTKTGRNAYIDRGITKYEHTYIRDMKTDQIIEDLTTRDNHINQIKEKEKAKEQGSIFYRTTEFDTSIHHIAGVYVCDTIPGYFKEDYVNVGDHYEHIYKEGDLEEPPKGLPCTRMVRVPFWRLGRKNYYDDGSIYSIDIMVDLPPRPWDEAEYKTGRINKEEYEKRLEKRKNYETCERYKKGEKYS